MLCRMAVDATSVSLIGQISQDVFLNPTVRHSDDTLMWKKITPKVQTVLLAPNRQMKSCLLARTRARVKWDRIH